MLNSSVSFNSQSRTKQSSSRYSTRAVFCGATNRRDEITKVYGLLSPLEKQFPDFYNEYMQGPIHKKIEELRQELIELDDQPYRQLSFSNINTLIKSKISPKIIVSEKFDQSDCYASYSQIFRQGGVISEFITFYPNASKDNHQVPSICHECTHAVQQQMPLTQAMIDQRNCTKSYNDAILHFLKLALNNSSFHPLMHAYTIKNYDSSVYKDVNVCFKKIVKDFNLDETKAAKYFAESALHESEAHLESSLSHLAIMNEKKYKNSDIYCDDFKNLGPASIISEQNSIIFKKLFDYFRNKYAIPMEYFSRS